MAVEFVITLDDKKLQANLARFVDRAVKLAKRVLTKDGSTLIGQIKTEAFAGRPRLLRRTGALSRGLKKVVADIPDGVAMLVVDSEKYARLQEEGGTVTAKGGGYLAIPLEPALTAGGVSRFASPLRSASVQFVCYPARDGTLYLWKKGESGPPYFKLQKSVKIPPRFGVRKQAKEFLPVIEKSLAQGLADLWNGKEKI